MPEVSVHIGYHDEVTSGLVAVTIRSRRSMFLPPIQGARCVRSTLCVAETRM